jgi:large subunit ribosomal protein L10
MNKDQKNEVIEALKEKFNQYNNFYVTNTEALTVEQVGKLRRICFNKNVEMKVAKNTLIRKALESIDAERYSGMFDSLNGVTALLFSENAKEPALIISTFRSESKSEKPVLKAAYIDSDVFVGNDQLETLKTLKSKQDLIGEIIGLLQSPAKNVISGLNAGGKLASLVKALEERAEA